MAEDTQPPADTSVTVIRTAQTRTKDLKLARRNPRRGDVDRIAESLQTSGQYRPIVVNVGTITGRRNEVLAGNHTLQAARKLGWPKVLASFVDVDDTAADRILIGDNRLADLGTYDTPELLDALQGLPDLLGTGYTELDLERLLNPGGTTTVRQHQRRDATPSRPDQVRILEGDSLEVLTQLDDASVDAVVTDPPYGLEFMGEDWDAPWLEQGRKVGAVIHDPAAERGGFQDGNGGNPYSRSRVEYGRGGASSLAFEAWCQAWAEQCLRVLKPGGHMVAFGGTRTWHRLAAGIEDAGFEIRDGLAWLYGQGFPKSHNLDGDHAGWGTALKPSFEPVVLARKPFDGSVQQNAETHGTGALHIEATRIGTTGGVTSSPTGAPRGNKVYGAYGQTDAGVDAGGRWPANVMLDEDQAAVLDEQSGDSVSRSASMPLPARPGFAGQLYGDHGPDGDSTVRGHDDAGGASRFMYVSKAGKAERPELDGQGHPTVKPLDIMRWLIRLVTPEGGHVLDPFGGSGTTAEAAVLEGMSCTIIEREPKYLPLIRQRVQEASEA